MCKAPRAPQLGLGRAGDVGHNLSSFKPRLDPSSVFPDDGGCGEAPSLGKVQLCVAVDEASCICQPLSPEGAPCQWPVGSPCSHHIAHPFSFLRSFPLASVFPSPTLTLSVLCQLSAGTQAEAASAQHRRWLSGPSFVPVSPFTVMLDAPFIMSLARH